MKLKLILTTAMVGVALALPSVASAAPPAPTFQDSVVLTRAPAVVLTSTGLTQINDLNATSGPSGENPSGLVRFDVFPPGLHFGGPVTCVAVSGNTATFNFLDEMDFGGIATIQVVDDQPDTFFASPSLRTPTDCSPLVPAEIDPLNSGDITVVDAQPPPTTTSQCLNNGWKQFGFANQGLCLAFVTRS
jgi:hypothetical protein